MTTNAQPQPEPTADRLKLEPIFVDDRELLSDLLAAERLQPSLPSATLASEPLPAAASTQPVAPAAPVVLDQPFQEEMIFINDDLLGDLV